MGYLQHAPTKKVRGRYRPWLWPWRLFGRLTKPIPPGLWIINIFVQRILRINARIPWMVHFTSKARGEISIGRNVWKYFAWSEGCYIQGGNGIIIGDDTIFAPGVKIISANHNPEDFSKWVKAEPIVIGKRCWIGANAVILPRVRLGDDVIVGAGAVVTHSFPSHSVIGGVPAKLLFTHDSRSKKSLRGTENPEFGDVN